MKGMKYSVFQIEGTLFLLYDYLHFIIRRYSYNVLLYNVYHIKYYTKITLFIGSLQRKKSVSKHGLFDPPHERTLVSKIQI